MEQLEGMEDLAEEAQFQAMLGVVHFQPEISHYLYMVTLEALELQSAPVQAQNVIVEQEVVVWEL
jgi:hypothetical protein